MKKLIKEFRFDASERRNVTLESGARLDPKGHCLTLVQGASSGRVKTRLTNPSTVRSWAGFQADDAVPDGAALAYRLSPDGSAELFWDGAGWSEAGENDWNTEQQVAENLSAFPRGPIQIIIRMTTTGPAPKLRRLKLLWDSSIVEMEDYVARSLVSALRAELRGRAPFVIDLGASSTTVNLNQIDGPYNITGVVAAYNITDDAAETTDLAASYDTSTKLLTLSGTITAGKRLKVVFEYAPEIVLARHADYVELAKVPAVLIESINATGGMESSKGEHVINRATGSGWELRNVVQAHLDFDFKVVAEKTSEAVRLSSELRSFLHNRQLRSVGQDELFPLQLLDFHDQATAPSFSGLNQARVRGRIANAVFYPSAAAAVSGVRRFVVTGGNLEFEQEG